MKNKIKRFIGLSFIIALGASFLTACSNDINYDLLGKNNKHWSNSGEGGEYNPFAYSSRGDYDDDYEYDDYDDDDDDYRPSSGSNGGSTYTEQYKFEFSLYDMPEGEASISVKRNLCTDEDVRVPQIYTDYEGKTYQVTKDYLSGFTYLENATSITLPSGFKDVTVGFNGCPNLKTVYLPSSIQSMGEHVITSCPRLSKIVFDGTKTQWNSITFDDHWNYLAQSIVIECSNGFIELQSWNESH